jgi:hypothetical protein
MYINIFTDLCMLKSEDKTLYPQVVRSENCSIHSKGDIYIHIYIYIYVYIYIYIYIYMYMDT